MGKRLGRLRRLPELEVLFPKTLREALLLLEKHNGAAKAIAGGTDLVPKIKRRLITPKYLIDLKGIAKLHFIRYSKRDGLRIGAATTLSEIEESSVVGEHYPILAEMVSQMASTQVRNIATMVGNLCNAVPSADTAPPLIALEARLKLVSPKGDRMVLVEDFFKRPEKTVLNSLELVTEVQVPSPRHRSGGVYLKHTLRSAMDLAIVGVAVYLALDSKKQICQDVKIGLGAVGPIPTRAKKAEAFLQGKVVSDELIEKVALKASDEARPIDDIRSSAEYRREMIIALTRRALKQSLEQLE